MFNLGFPELLALGGLALLVIGPKQLPEVAKVVARTLNELKRATKDITGTIAQVKTDATSKVDEYINDISNDVGDVEEDYHNIGNENVESDIDDDGQMSLLTEDDEDRS